MTRAALSVGVCGAAVLLGCAPGKPACAPEVLAAIEARYSARVIAACGGKSFDECPDVPALKAQRAAEEKEASCR